MKVRDVCQAMENLAPQELAYDGDPIGLRIGAPDWDVTRVMVALTVTPDAVAAAIGKRADMIVSHHPVMWDPLRALRADVPHTRMCLELAERRIACFAAHTNLDLVPGGVNDALADALELVECAPLFPAPHATLLKLVTFVPETHLAAVRDAVCRAGAGVIGEYTHCTFSAPGAGTFLPSDKAKPFSGEACRLNEEPERRLEVLVPKSRLNPALTALRAAHPYEEPAYDIVTLENEDPRIGLGRRGTLKESRVLGGFAEQVRAALGLSHVRVTGDAGKRVRTVAVLGGAGGKHVREVQKDIDVFVTGDIGYHDAIGAQESGLALIDASHAGTERVIVPVVARYLKRRFKSLRVVTYQEPETFRVALA